ncbi:MAG: DUF4142 domain-containing protein, partial [Acidobacteriota bacterium]
MKFSRTGSSFLLAGLAVVFGLVLTTTAMADTSKNDQKFVKEAASGGMLEVKLGEVAMNQATNPAVKEFAQRLINDHSKANSELLSLAEKKNIDVPKEMNQEHRSMYEHLSQLKGADFDRQYMRHMIEDHIQD